MDTEKEALLAQQNTTQPMIPGTIPLPDDLVTIASSNEDKPKIDGFFFPKKDITFVSLLSLANPDNDPKENERKLTKVQELLRTSIKSRLEKACYGCVNHVYENRIYKWVYVNAWVGNRSRYKPGCSKCLRFPDEHEEILLTILADASICVNQRLYNELSRADSKELINERAQYKVIGSLYLLCKRHGCEQQLVRQFKTSSGKLPCELGNAEDSNGRFWIQTKPALDKPTMKDLIFEPLDGGATKNVVANSVLNYLSKNTKPEVIIIDKRKLIYKPQQIDTEEYCGDCTIL